MALLASCRVQAPAAMHANLARRLRHSPVLRTATSSAAVARRRSLTIVSAARGQQVASTAVAESPVSVGTNSVGPSPAELDALNGFRLEKTVEFWCVAFADGTRLISGKG